MSLEQFGKNYEERVEKAVAAIKQGKGILLVDDADRENEGDIIFAAEKMTVKDMALMIRECSGIVCLCLTPEMAENLELPLMVKDNTSKYGTAFTITIEAKEGVTTGVSAADRITTIQAAIKDGAKPEDLSHPGHVFPLIAKAGGVLERGGHTEGSVDLARLAGCKPAGVLCELTNEDGTMAKMPEITAFAKKHGMTVVSIEDICEYRKNKC
ncbi:MAG: 3,4-dihydroxy-2-butanone-4-phosphate synthase [bacterium]